MSAWADTRTTGHDLRDAVGAGVVGGFVGGIGMGGILHLAADLMPFIGALYGVPTVLGGWIAHLVNSVLVGVLFSLIVSRPVIRREMSTVLDATVAGVIYAAAAGLVMSGAIFPIAMNLLGRQTFPEPLLRIPGIFGGILVFLSVGVAHMVYGLLLGGIYGYVQTG